MWLCSRSVLLEVLVGVGVVLEVGDEVLDVLVSPNEVILEVGIGAL